MRIIIRAATLVNEGSAQVADLMIRDQRIEKIAPQIATQGHVAEINGEGLYLFPGIIDDQVHFREPGLTYKADIYTESRAAVAGGVTSTMDMPNVKPPSLTRELLEERYRIASKTSATNYSFYMGTSNKNSSEVLAIDPKKVCGIKIFMGSSTGNMLVDDDKTLETIFRNAPVLIATHCEDEETIRHNLEKFRQEYGDDIPLRYHPVIRSVEACYKSSSQVVALAKKYNTRLHILHISTAEELDLFSSDLPIEEKRITAEVCVHHLFFDAGDYDLLGTRIKWNPAIKESRHKEALMQGLLEGKLDVVATDHAPHTLEEKENVYTSCPSGGPLVQHSLNVMLELYHQGKITLEKIAEKMSHNVARCFSIRERGYLREGYFADMVLVDINKPYTVSHDNILYKCGWSPFEGKTFSSSVMHTFVNGFPVYNNGMMSGPVSGMRLEFVR